MVKSVENGLSLPPFLVKCYEMVNDESTNELISWTETNDSFIIWDESKFSSQLLPKYFKHSNFSSFVRQLNIYGFRKIDTDRWQFANEDFIKGQKHLLKNISRRKHPQSLVPKKSAQQKDVVPDPPLPIASEEDKIVALWKEVENLNTDKTALTQELKKLRQHQETSQSKLLLVREQLKGMEKNQQQMLSFIVMAMQSSEFMVQFFQPKDNNWQTGKTKLSEVIDDYELTPSGGTIVKYQPPKDGGHSVSAYAPEASNFDDLMDLDFTSDEMRDLLMDIDILFSPKDDKLISGENHGQLVLPHIPENDTMLEQLLLSNSWTEDEQVAELETEASDDSGVDVGLSFQPKVYEKSNGSEDDVDEYQNPIGTSEKVEVLTKQMGSLASERS